MPTVLCMSNDSTCGYIAGIHFCLYTDKRSIKSCKFAKIHQNFVNTILYTIYVTNNLCYSIEK